MQKNTRVINDWSTSIGIVERGVMKVVETTAKEAYISPKENEKLIKMRRLMDKVELLIIILMILIAIAIVVGLYAYFINSSGFEEFIERLKRLEK